jgi:DNA-binding transcriptional regulator GbsR (MarR family)
MLNPTVSSVVKIMLEFSDITQIELSHITQKSLPSISRALSLLVSKNFVKINYFAPGKSWSIIDKDQILSFMRETHPNLYDSNLHK